MDVVFDLDGTLIDSKAGIVDCLRSALIEHGLAWTEPLDWCIGPPAELCMEHLLPTESPATREHIVRMYREHYQRRGWKNSHLYPGVRELLDQLHRDGHRLFIRTAKKREFLELTLKLHGLDHDFISVAADSIASPARSKSELLRELQTSHGLKGVMIGDRAFDITAGRAANLRTIAVLYGYGARDELVAAHPDFLCVTLQELGGLLAYNQNRPHNGADHC